MTAIPDFVSAWFERRKREHIGDQRDLTRRNEAVPGKSLSAYPAVNVAATRWVHHDKVFVHPAELAARRVGDLQADGDARP